MAKKQEDEEAGTIGLVFLSIVVGFGVYAISVGMKVNPDLSTGIGILAGVLFFIIVPSQRKVKTKTPYI